MNFKTVNIKGKNYVEVKERLNYLANEIKEYSIETDYEYIDTLKMFIVKATLKMRGQIYTGHSQAVIGSNNINRDASLENCETSAVGRACGMAGIGVEESIASADEIKKANNEKDEYVLRITKWLNIEVPKQLESFNSISEEEKISKIMKLKNDLDKAKTYIEKNNKDPILLKLIQDYLQRI